ncbi:glycosyltransferase involved in cell wall biosynthesis [Peribacillus deserti]|uniref:Glycosyltransferase involved in cell wall biosynthesis n=1 Tax=Peribacillus deserti TaxID=673318 RepID=A0ABS2QDH2_9BACI|nr:glycosyltransferase family 2 protein [Peribacillus deserti]MBM7691205.1 glycosyltransferase involved in cell wall biosynthesis [Peribacillus deserti]
MIEPVLTIVVPCFNEEQVLPQTITELEKVLRNLVDENLIASSSRILLVDDGSRDNTWRLIYKASLHNQMIKGLKLSRNVGHQNALLAGLNSAKEVSDCVISIDADLQDDTDVIREFIIKYRDGCEIVYGVRRKRDTDTVFKRKTAEMFYSIMKKMGVNLVYNHADFRLMSKRALQELEKFQEVNMFLRGIVPLIGFQSASVYYDRKERLAGETKYPLKKMLAFAFDGITSFSVTPIRMVLLIGFLSFFGSCACGIYFLILKLIGETATGWTSLITSIWLLGGLQLIAMGLIGEYIGKIYKESKGRPKYIIDFNPFLPITGRQTNSQGLDHEAYTLNLKKLPETN